MYSAAALISISILLRCSSDENLQLMDYLLILLRSQNTSTMMAITMKIPA
jgi:hypothetical protein